MTEVERAYHPRVAFFEPPPSPRKPDDHEEEFPQPEWIGPPDNWLGTPVPLRLVLARTDKVALAITSVAAFPSGLSFELSIRRNRKRHEDYDPFEHMPFGHPARRAREQSEKQLRFGVEFADGAKATTVDPGPWAHDREEEPDRPVLVQGGGGGGMGSWDFDFWVWPLPPAGRFAFVCEWRAEGVELTRQELDAGVFRQAAEQAEMLWENGGPAARGGATLYGPLA